MAVTPMMQQYEEIKEKYKDCILMFRLGDFYEMFNDDAKIASRELELTLTGRASGGGEKAPMCGVPFHSAESYISRLVSRGYKVAICEQMEDASQTKDIVRRDVIRVVTPGTLMDTNVIAEKENNFLCLVYADGEKNGLAFADASTGEIYITSIEKEDATEEILNEISCYKPKEIVYSPYARSLYYKPVADRFKIYVSGIGDEFFLYENCLYGIKSGLELTCGQKDILEEKRELAVCVGAVLLYLREMQKTDANGLCSLNIYTIDQSVGLDRATRRNLEITSTLRENGKKGSLLWVLDKTKTSMGGRLMRRWIEKPLVSIAEIKHRHEGVGELKDNMMARGELSELLDGVYDLKRIIGRISLNSVTPRDLLALRDSLEKLPEIKNVLSGFKSDILTKINYRIYAQDSLVSLLQNAIRDDAPANARDGGFIKSGFNQEVDQYKKAKDESAGWLSEIQAEEREKTGIKTLKVGYNKVFGYYIEVSKGQTSLVPDYYVRKQTLVNGERYITERLKEVENIILGAEDKLLKVELYLFDFIKERISDKLEELKKTADAISQVDVLASFAQVAQEMNYCMPEMTKDGEIKISDGRHPVVEKVLKNEIFVPNDTVLDTAGDRLMIITGPNMAGKSTYMRQVALISLMAQAGSFVPAREAKLSVVDSIFTRVGASDDLAAGQSTFMVEMNEVSNILKNATKDSLVIFDEIGRGTSTFDGLSIAWAVAEFVADKKKIGAKTLFATHYHELTELERLHDGIKNYCVSVKKRGDEITFLRKIIRGCAPGSYGIEVAALAGVPKEVLMRAKQILSELEDKNETGGVAKAKSKAKTEADITADDMSIMSFETNDIIAQLAEMDVTTYTPIEALNKLYELSGKAKKI